MSYAFVRVFSSAYVSRAYKIYIVHRPSIIQIISVPDARFSFKFWLLLPLGNMPRLFLIFEIIFGFFTHIFRFLALLDYVSRAHEIEIRPSSVHPSSVRPSVASYCMDFFQILVVASPGPYAQTFLSCLEKKIF